MPALHAVHKKAANSRSALYVALLFLLAGLLLAGCSAKTAPKPIGSPERPGIYDPAMLTHIKDFDRLPQDLTVYAQNAPKFDLRDEQAQAAARFIRLFFSPWAQTSSSVSVKDAAWAERAYAARVGYTADGGVIPMSERNAASENAQFYLYPSLAAPGIVTGNALMRAMPTTKPFYDNPAKPGQGFPFDDYQMTALWIGTPVFISHISADRKWLFCETAVCSGWVEASKVAQVDAAFINAWRDAPLHAVTRDRMNVGGAELRIGALLPVKSGQLLLPKREASGRAAVTRISASAGLEPFPVPFTPKAAAALGNQFMGKPYGWGGAFFERDCSLMLQNLFTPFGVWLPRNSSAQLKNGWKMDLTNMAPEAKVAWLADNAVPFRTLLGMPGHVTLYLGEYKGEGVIFHSIWGLRVLTAQGEGRAVLGKVCVTSLTPGEELRDIIPEKMLLYRFATAATLLTGGGY